LSRHSSGGREAIVKAHADARAQLDAVYASERLPFDGDLFVGY
jgi:hypothetical protein